MTDKTKAKIEAMADEIKRLREALENYASITKADVERMGDRYWIEKVVLDAKQALDETEGECRKGAPDLIGFDRDGNPIEINVRKRVEKGSAE